MPSRRQEKQSTEDDTVTIKKDDLLEIQHACYALEALENILSSSEQEQFLVCSNILKPITEKFASVLD